MLEPSSTDSDSGEEVSGIRWLKEKINKSRDILNLFQKHILKLDINCNNFHGERNDKTLFQLTKKLRKVLKTTEYNIKTLDDDILSNSTIRFSKKESEQLLLVNYDSSISTKKSNCNTEEPPLILHIKRKTARGAVSRAGPKKSGRTVSVNSLSSEFQEEDETQQNDIDINKVLATLNKDISSDEDGGKNSIKKNSDDDVATEDCFIKDCKVKVQRLGRRTVTSSNSKSRRSQKNVDTKDDLEVSKSKTPSLDTPISSTRGRRNSKKVSYKDRESSNSDSESGDVSKSSRTNRSRGSRQKKEEQSESHADDEDDEARTNEDGEVVEQVNGSDRNQGSRSLRQRAPPKKEPPKKEAPSAKKRSTRTGRSSQNANSEKTESGKAESETAGDSDQSRSRRGSSRRSQRKPPVSYASDQEEEEVEVEDAEKEKDEEKEVRSEHIASDTDSLDMPIRKPDDVDTEDMFEKLREGSNVAKADDSDLPASTNAVGKQRSQRSRSARKAGDESSGEEGRDSAEELVENSPKGVDADEPVQSEVGTDNEEDTQPDADRKNDKRRRKVKSSTVDSEGSGDNDDTFTGNESDENAEKKLKLTEEDEHITSTEGLESD